MKYPKFLLHLSILAISFSLYACHTVSGNKQTSDNEQVNMHSAYDDSTLNRHILPVLMPYNRIIDPAGTVISFGDAADENHSMDVRLIPGTRFIAVEDRYGLTIIDTVAKKVTTRWTYKQDTRYRELTSTYSGLKVVNIDNQTQIYWSAAAGKGKDSKSYVFQAIWKDGNISIQNTFNFKAEGESPLALPNDLAINKENGINYLYVVLNGNNQLAKINLTDNKTVWIRSTGVAPYGLTIAKNKIFLTNWAGPQAIDTLKRETAGVPYGKAYVDPKTGATVQGTVMVMDLAKGDVIKEIPVGLHPNAIINSADEAFVYVANGNSDMVSVISTSSLQNVAAIDVKLNPGKKVI
ncbi:YncE family protein [Mucilaginibacter sp. P19]|uniref:YncE family protein n=1 Tax=Mucilaginibacter sp. P19 TaxID=3423947 RepID=UPI003D671992